MEKRININELEPKAYRALSGLERFSGDSDLNPFLKELIKVRASQINGCAYCIKFHRELALKEGESEERLSALAEWRNSPLFNREEKIVLSLTEEITHISKSGVARSTYEDAIRSLGENGVARVIMQIVAINAWNRIALSTNMQ
jgi:AhpD family alkylhydroperoxidase